MAARDDYSMYDGDSYDSAMDEIDRLREALRVRTELVAKVRERVDPKPQRISDDGIARVWAVGFARE